MYGLPQAGRLAYNKLKPILIEAGYRPAVTTPGLGRDTNSDMQFVLVVDDFGIKWTNEKQLNKLASVLRTHYEITIDWTGKKFLGMTLEWDYDKGWMDVSVPGYLKNVFIRHQHPPPKKPELCTHDYPTLQYGRQYCEDTPDEPPLPNKQITTVQEIVGAVLWYARICDPLLLTSLNDLSTEQTNATTITAKKVTRMLNYCATYPDNKLRYYASDMVLYVHSDGSYLSAPKARSRTGGHFFLSSWPKNINEPPGDDLSLNEPILNISQIMREVMSSAAEIETGSLFKNAKEAVVIRNTFIEMGHPQPSTPIQVDNVIAAGFANETIKPKRSKAFDMRFYWLQDRKNRGQFLIYWKPGKKNLADYFTKFYSPKEIKEIKHYYVLTNKCYGRHDTARVC